MNQPRNNSATLLDIVFNGRNKNYGAYDLRLSYNRNLCRALLWVILSAAGFSISFYFTQKAIIKNIQDTGQLNPAQFIEVPVEIQPIPKPNSSSSSKPAAPASPAEPLVIRDDAPAAVQPETTPAAIAENTLSAGMASVSTQDLPSATTPLILNPDTVYESHTIESYPEFNGGLSALRRFVASHLRYPAEEAERGQEGIVLVRFIVDEFGVVSKVSAQISAGPAFDKEAVRVVSMLPPFKSPGRAGGRAVKVAFTLPVKFRSQ